MVSHIFVRRAWAAAALGVAVSVSGCSGAASPSSGTPAPAVTASATVTPAPTPSLSPTPSSIGSPGPSAAIDPAGFLRIGSPYTLKSLDPAAEAEFEAEMEKGLGSLTTLIKIGVRNVEESGSTVAMVLVMVWPEGVLTDATYIGALGGMTGTTGATFTKTTVSGIEVSTGTATSGGGVGAYRRGDTSIIVVTQRPSETLPVIRSLISAGS